MSTNIKVICRYVSVYWKIICSILKPRHNADFVRLTPSNSGRVARSWFPLMMNSERYKSALLNRHLVRRKMASPLTGSSPPGQSSRRFSTTESRSECMLLGG